MVLPGTEKVFKLTPSGRLTERAAGLTTVLGLAFDHQGRLFVLESMTAPGFPGALYVSNIGFGPPVPGLGQIVRVAVAD